MSARDPCPLFHERCCSRLPIKIPHVKYKDRRRYPCCYSRMYSTACGADRSPDIEDGREASSHRMLKNFARVDKATQMSIKNFYESYILEGLLSTSDVKKKFSTINSTELTEDIDYLSDIRNILMTTNDKLDLILSALADKKEQLINSLGKQRKCKQKVKSEGIASASNVSLPLMRSETGDRSDIACHMCPWAKCISSTCLTRLRPNPFYISPYFPPYYVKPISHYNYFKIFGPKYSDPDMTNNLWSPFMFMASNFNVKKLQEGINKERLTYQLNDDNGNPLGFDEDNAENRGHMTCEEDIEERLSTMN